ncbi:MAG: MaoC family dehydratase [Promethearchaeota archaeon]
MAKVTLDSPAALKDYEGKELGVSDWVEVTQEKINMFADATGDHQWIHVDVERAKKESPFGGPIAHGYWTLSVIADLMFQILEVKCKLVVNYGLNRTRFPAPVHVGKRVRGRASLAGVKELGGGNLEVEFNIAVEVEGSEKPACVAAVVYRYYV